MRCGVVLLGCIFCQFLASISLKSGEEAPEAEKFPFRFNVYIRVLGEFQLEENIGYCFFKTHLLVWQSTSLSGLVDLGIYSLTCSLDASLLLASASSSRHHRAGYRRLRT